LIPEVLFCFQCFLPNAALPLVLGTSRSSNIGDEV